MKQRLSTVDWAFLQAESPSNLAHVAGLWVFSLPKGVYSSLRGILHPLEFLALLASRRAACIFLSASSDLLCRSAVTLSAEVGEAVAD